MKRQLLCFYSMLPTFAIGLIGCKTAVHLTVTNHTVIPQVVDVSVKDPSGGQVNDIVLGTVDKDKSVSSDFKVKHYGQIMVTGSIPGSAEISESSKTVLPNPDPLNLNIDLPAPGNLLDSQKAAQQIQNALRNLGKNVGYAPIPVQNGLDTIFGALILISTNDPTQENIWFKLTPGQFAPKVALTDFRYPDTSSSDTVEIDGSSSADVAASVPVYGSLNIENSASSVYKVSYALAGFGMVEKSDPADWDYLKGIRKLTSDQISGLTKAMRTHPDAELLYVNKIYVVKSATFDYTKGNKISTGGKLSIGSIATVTGAYSFSQDDTKKLEVQTTVVNVDGVVISLSTDQVGQPNSIDIKMLEMPHEDFLEGLNSGKQKIVISGVRPFNGPLVLKGLK